MKRFTPFYFLFMVLAIVGLVPDLSGASWAQAQTAQAQKPKALKASRSPRMRHNPKQGPPAVVGPPGIGRSLGCTIANQTSDTGLPCLQALTPLMPPEESNDPKQPKGYRGWYGGYTMREQPTLWVYIGYTQQSGVPLMLELYDAESATPQTAVLSRSIPKPEQASFVSISINHSLAVKRWYRWRLVAKNSQATTGDRRGDLSCVGGWDDRQASRWVRQSDRPE
jgi:Domain of Unknown Function (DUF928)